MFDFGWLKLIGLIYLFLQGFLQPAIATPIGQTVWTPPVPPSCTQALTCSGWLRLVSPSNRHSAPDGWCCCKAKKVPECSYLQHTCFQWTTPRCFSFHLVSIFFYHTLVLCVLFSSYYLSYFFRVISMKCNLPCRVRVLLLFWLFAQDIWRL